MWTIIATVAAVIVGALMIGAISPAAQRLFTGSSTGTATSEASDIWTNARGVWGAGGATGPISYANVTNQSAIRAGAVPSQMLNGDGQTISGPWSGSAVTLASYANGAGLQQTWTGVPNSSCAKFAASQQVVAITINGTEIDTTKNTTPDQIAAACTAPTNAGGTGTLVFGYRDIAGQ